MLSAIPATPSSPGASPAQPASLPQEGSPDWTAFQGMDVMEAAHRSPEYLKAQQDLEIQRAIYARAMRVPAPPQPKSVVGHLARCLLTGVRVGAAADRMAEWENARRVYARTLEGAEIALRATEQAALARVCAERQQSQPSAETPGNPSTPQISSDQDTVRIGNLTLPRNKPLTA